MPSIDEMVSRGLRAHLAAATDAERLGWKVAFNTAAVQERLGLTSSLVARLTRRTLEPAEAPHRLNGSTRVALEAEVAVQLGRDVVADAGPDAAAAAVEAWAPAIEIVEFNRPLSELESILVEGVFHRALRLGPAAAPAPGVDLRGVVARVRHAGSQLCEVDAGEATGDVSEVLLHLARLLALHGERLARGDVVILGSMNPVAFAQPGTEFSLDLAGIGAVSVGLTD
jgi:2-keto-4-pentenoate hydratase